MRPAFFKRIFQGIFNHKKPGPLLWARLFTNEHTVEQMTKLVKFFNFKLRLIVAITMVSGTMVSGCDVGTSGPGQEKEKKRPLSFRDSSKGLPSSGLWREGIAFSDMNGDGQIDIVAPPPRKAAEKYAGPVAWYGNGMGEWAEARLEVPSSIGYGYGSVAVSDFDGDGIPDIALAMHMVRLRAIRGVGQGKYVDFSGGMPPAQKMLSRAVVSADFNNDGISDIAALSEAQFVQGNPLPKGVWTCYRAGERWKCDPAGKKDDGLFLFGDQLFTGDVNGDGNKDIAVASLAAQNNEIVWLGDGKGGFVPFYGGLPQKKIYYAVALGDIDQDGKDDLIASISGFGEDGFLGLKAFLSRPDTFEEISEGLPVGVLFTALATGDLDGDGTLEVIGGTAEGGLRVFSRKGNVWKEVDVSGLPEKGLKKIYHVYCMDMNKDGLEDIAINYAGQESSGGIRVFYNTTDKNQEDKGR